MNIPYLRAAAAFVAALTIGLAATACTDTALPGETSDDLTAASSPGAPKFSVIRSQAQAKKTKPAARAYRIHDIDVGTGLSILVQGSTWNLLFDGGSGDDLGNLLASGNNNRLLAYLFATLGPSGGKECAPKGDAAWASYAGGKHVTIHHLFLSHPHLDHGSMLADVLHCYDVNHVWDSGAINDVEFYRQFVQAVADEPAVSYHTAAPVPANRTLTIAGKSIVVPSNVSWSQFDDSVRVKLDDNAAFAILNADGTAHADANQNSIVARVDLGSTSLLLVGDAESGARRDPSNPVGDVELRLMTRHKKEIDVDILQVGHHGSSTSSRSAFIDAISPTIALIGVGPKQYASVVFPEKPVIDLLTQRKVKILRTDVNDGKCPVADKIGLDTAGPAGCDTQVIDIPALPAPKNAMGSQYATCSGRCGNEVGLCACDANCLQRGDCCDDVCSWCTTLPLCAPPPTTPPKDPVQCSKMCGKTLASGECSCADDCRATGNCCFDVCRRCTSAPMCQVGFVDDPFAP